jgi:hypothetical protein
MSDKSSSDNVHEHDESFVRGVRDGKGGAPCNEFFKEHEGGANESYNDAYSRGYERGHEIREVEVQGNSKDLPPDD